MPVPFVLLAPGALGTGGSADAVPLPADVAKHLRTVLRLEPGAPLVLADGAGVTAPAVLLPDGARLTGPLTQEPRPEPVLHVAQGVAKGRKLDEVVRTLTELGVDRITPVAADRSVTKLEGPKRDRAVDRWRSVVRAACEQSRRAWVPRVDPPATVAALTADLDGAAAVVAHVGATGSLRATLADVTAGAQPRRVVVAVGPEGGWTPDEVDAFEAAGARVVSLGPAVLRTEHAAPALVAVVNYVLGRMG